MSADQYRVETPTDLRCPECNTVDGKDVFVVINHDGLPEFVANVESYCHDHINDALRHRQWEAGRWVVRRYRQVHFDPAARTTAGERSDA